MLLVIPPTTRIQPAIRNWSQFLHANSTALTVRMVAYVNNKTKSSPDVFSRFPIHYVKARHVRKITLGSFIFDLSSDSSFAGADAGRGERLSRIQEIESSTNNKSL